MSKQQTLSFSKASKPKSKSEEDILNSSKDPKYSNVDVVYQWRKLKTKVAQFILENKSPKDNAINYIFTDAYFDIGFEGIKEIIEIYQVLPCSNAEVERGFSAMKRIKTLERNKLLPETLFSLMMISLDGPSNELWRQDNINQYIHWWVSNYNVNLEYNNNSSQN